MDLRRFLPISFASGFLCLSMVAAVHGQTPAAKPTAPPTATGTEGVTSSPGTTPADKAAKDAAAKDAAAKDAAAKDAAAKALAADAQKDKQPVVLSLKSAACFKTDKKSPDKLLPDDCELGKNIVLTFDNLVAWSKDPTATANKPQNLVLLLNGKLLKGVTPAPSSSGDPNELQFELKRLDAVEGDQDSTDNRATWNALMGRAMLRQMVKVGVVLAGSPPSSARGLVIFRILPWYWKWVGLFLLLLLAIFLLLTVNSDILRDGPTSGADKSTHWWKFGRGGGPKNSFSLARCQMAWWFFIILASFLYIWIIFGDTDTLTAGALVLMGISAATGFSSFLVDSSKEDARKSLQTENDSLVQRLQVLTDALAAAPGDAALIAEKQQKQARLDEVTKDLAALPTPVGESQGFLNDILRDESGVSFHRFQMAAWTIVLGFVFAMAVYRNLAMPDFSSTLLGLMGISAGTYVGFKIPNPAK